MIAKPLLIRKLAVSDYQKGYLDLLEHLTTVNKDQISLIIFQDFIESLHNHHLIYVIEEESKGLIIASGTLLIEPKLIHGASYVGHIEDIVVHPHYRHQKLGTALVTNLIHLAEEAGCYKVILDCREDLINFYKNCKLSPKERQMVLYI